MRSIAHHDHGQKPERMKFLRIIFGCPEGAENRRILFLLCFCIAKISLTEVGGIFLPGTANAEKSGQFVLYAQADMTKTGENCKKNLLTFAM